MLHVHIHVLGSGIAVSWSASCQIPPVPLLRSCRYDLSRFPSLPGGMLSMTGLQTGRSSIARKRIYAIRLDDLRDLWC